MGPSIDVDLFHHSRINVDDLEHRRVSWVASTSLAPDDLCHSPCRLIRYHDAWHLHSGDGLPSVGFGAACPWSSGMPEQYSRSIVPDRLLGGKECTPFSL